MIRNIFILILFLFSKDSIGQLFVARDTICVIENNYVLKMPWANGINYSNISSTDLNYDGKKVGDIVKMAEKNSIKSVVVIGEKECEEKAYEIKSI